MCNLLFADGVEPTGSPRQVSSLNHLLWISTNSSSWGDSYIQTSDIDASGTSSWNSGSGFSPIGNNTTKFTGTYDGDNYVISNLYINRASEDHIGLFGLLDGATLTELGLTQCNVSGNLRVGGLVGKSDNYSDITKCYAYGTVSGSTTVGGLVGDNANYSTISYCYADASVSSGDYAGGLIATNNVQGSLRNCYARGSVSGDRMVGGLIGYSLTSTSYYCYATGSVTGNQYVGGFVGSYTSYAPSSSCFYDKNTTGQTDTGKGLPKTTSQMKTQSTYTNAGYDFTVDGEDDDWKISTANDGYPLLVWSEAVDSSLPVSLTHFSAEYRKNGIHVTWVTESEVENLGFILERNDIFESGRNWIEIATYLSDNALLGQGSTSERTDYVYKDSSIEPNKQYEYRLADVSYYGVKKYHIFQVLANTPQLLIPVGYSLHQNFPNPFNPRTIIRYNLPEHSGVILTVYDATGMEVTTLYNNQQPAGQFQVEWNGMDESGGPVSAGLYFAHLQAGEYSKTIKMVYMK